MSESDETAENSLEDMVNDPREALLKSRKTKRASEPSLAGIPKGLKGLTQRQEIMAEAIAAGRAGIDAYRIAFECPNSTDRTVQRKVTYLLARPDMREAIAKAKARMQSEYERASLRTARDITLALWREAESRENTGAMRIRALELLGKEQGMFDRNGGDARDKPHHSVAEIEEQIRSMLDRHLGGNAILISGK